MSEPIMVGPGTPCMLCGGEYGEHADDCQFMTTRVSPGPSLAAPTGAGTATTGATGVNTGTYRGGLSGEAVAIPPSPAAPTAEQRAVNVTQDFYAKRYWGYDPNQHAEFEGLIAADIHAAERAAWERACEVAAQVAANHDGAEGLATAIRKIKEQGP